MFLTVMPCLLWLSSCVIVLYRGRLLISHSKPAGQSLNSLRGRFVGRGGIVYLRVEKIPSSALRQSTGLRLAQCHESCGAALYGGVTSQC